jgi:hypothetical protein
MVCHCPTDCTYGQQAEAVCHVFNKVNCTGSRTLHVPFNCRYCFQSSVDDYACEASYDCNAVGGERQCHYTSNCTVTKAKLLCLGRREFLKREMCNWTAGLKWTTTLALSITLGGFGADRYDGVITWKCSMTRTIYFCHIIKYIVSVSSPVQVSAKCTVSSPHEYLSHIVFVSV